MFDYIVLYYLYFTWVTVAGVVASGMCIDFCTSKSNLLLEILDWKSLQMLRSTFILHFGNFRRSNFMDKIDALLTLNYFRKFEVLVSGFLVTMLI